MSAYVNVHDQIGRTLHGYQDEHAIRSDVVVCSARHAQAEEGEPVGD